jgi:hypothetical protein
MVTWAEWVEARGLESTTVTVKTPAGVVASGQTYTTTTLSPCIVQDQRKRVPVGTDQAAGGVKISTALVVAPLTPTVPAGARVTMADGAETTVLVSTPVTAHGLPLPEHQELDCG